MSDGDGSPANSDDTVHSRHPSARTAADGTDH